jgi:curved DNA-binding protein CbpA
MDYYLLLGIPPDADADTIRSAFRTLARRYHPDAGEGSSAERFREIVVAYETLNDPARRGDYDRVLRKRRAPRPTVQIVEPLRASLAPEPMLRPRSRVLEADRFHNPLDQGHLHTIIDEFFRSWDELFFGALGRRDRM